MFSCYDKYIIDQKKHQNHNFFRFLLNTYNNFAERGDVHLEIKEK